jgi:hypothetical protein
MEKPFVLSAGSWGQVFPNGTRPVFELPYNIAVFLNVSRLRNDLVDETVTVAPGHDLRRANEQEIEAIKEVLNGFLGYVYGITEEAWEAESMDGKARKLPQGQWRYFVIAWETPGNLTIDELERALTIARFELRIGFVLLKGLRQDMYGHPALIINPNRLFQLIGAVSQGYLEFMDITPSIVEELKLLHHRIRSLDSPTVDMKGLIDGMLELEALPPSSSLLFLGYFAILESLLTHKPDPKDTIDSIARQVKRKLSLLDNRWQPPLDYAAFGGANRDKVWGAMYAYRSCLAHGSKGDFGGDLRLLQGHRPALRLLKDTVKAVLRQAIVEPQLVLDLRHC